MAGLCHLVISRFSISRPQFIANYSHIRSNKMTSKQSFETIDCEEVDLLDVPSGYHSGSTDFHKKVPSLLADILRSNASITTFAFVQVITLSAVFILGAATMLRPRDVSAWRIPITISKHIPANFCGTTPAEARAAGCAFEVNNLAWLHPNCYDAELEDDWNNGPLSGGLEYWEHIGGIGQISKDLILAGEAEGMWVNMRQHRRHCVFVWEKYLRAAINQRPTDNWTSSYMHSMHCIKW